MRRFTSTLFVLSLVCLAGNLLAQHRVLDDTLHHLRSGGEREWASFPPVADHEQLELNFEAAVNTLEKTLQLRQVDVRQGWEVFLNDSLLGRLTRDEKDMTVYFSVPRKGLREGNNRLLVQPVDGTPDDIRVGDIVLHERPKAEVLSQGRLEITVRDRDSRDPIPSRITITNESGSLQAVGASSNDHMAVRNGVVYTGNGRAAFGLPVGIYTVYANRGPEYGIDSVQISVEVGTRLRETLAIHREVETPDHISSDTHVHTYTHSGHGDSSTEERLLTVAGENVELPIATEHNTHADYRPMAEKMEVSDQFTTVIGNEVTTKVGHFNIFPVEKGAPVPDYHLTAWASLFESIYSTPYVRVAILNHGRDNHAGFRPLDPSRFNAAVGEFVDGREPEFDAMEVVNSGAQQTDIMRLFHDWFALLNRGYRVTPVGSSDAHDVSRFIVGQGRTYIELPGSPPAHIDAAAAAERLAEGRVTVSLGLFTEITVDGEYGPGQLAVADDGEVTVNVRVQGPGWVTADRVALYANGENIRESEIEDGNQPGVKWENTWTLSGLEHDVHLVAVARGPGVRGPYWPIAKPYQPTSKKWTPEVIGVTGAVWVDVEGDGGAAAAYDYATDIVGEANGDLPKLLEVLAGYDEAVAAQAASIYHDRLDGELQTSGFKAALQEAAPHVRRGFKQYVEAQQKTTF